MAMFATLRDGNGHVLGSVPVDPSKPGGINNQIQAAMQQMQQQGTIPQDQRPSPQRGQIVQNAPNQYAQATIRLRYLVQGPDGRPRWQELVQPCPPGATPGTYVFQSTR